MAQLGSIIACGAYVPRLRLPRAVIGAATGWLSAPNTQRGSGARAICNWDEDAVTLAVAAARSARSACSAERIDCLYLASTSLPFADRDCAALVASALDLPATLETLNVTTTLRAGTSALANAARRRDSRVLVVASDARTARPGSSQELQYGHGAAAVLVDPSVTPSALASLLAVEQVAHDFVDHYRAAGEPFDYRFEDRWIRDEGYAKLVADALVRALRGAGVNPADVRHLAMPGPPDVIKRVVQIAQLTQATPSEALGATCGDAGAAQPLLMLADVLERAQPGELLLLVGFGQGVDVLLLRTETALAQRRSRPLQSTLARGIEENSYVRYLSHAGLLDVDFGMRAEHDNRTAQTVAWRKHRVLTAFIGGRCTRCGTVQFPPAHACVNPECRALDTQIDYPLADTTGRIKSFTEDWQAYSPRPPAIYGNIELAEGGNLLMELTDVAPGQLAVGDPVHFTFRVKDVDRRRAFRRYFWKATKE